MQKVFSASAQQVFIVGIHKDIPQDACPITDAEELEYVGKRPHRHLVEQVGGGGWQHIQAPEAAPSGDSLCQSVDRAADIARRKVAGDPLRAEEYKVAAAEAQTYKDANYAGEAPRAVAAWALNGRTPQQSADSILAEAAAYNSALHLIRETRLLAKECIRSLMDAGSVAQAQDVAAEAIAAIEAAVEGVGNNPQAD